MSISSFGFILLRHVQDSRSNRYWQYSYDCIRSHYPDKWIMIIDDNSHYEHVTIKPLDKTIMIQSEFTSRGELLPYYYYLKFPFFEKALILHDSVFLHQPMDWTSFQDYQFLWSFSPTNFPEDQLSETYLQLFKDSSLMDFYHQKEWFGCFGVMCLIEHRFLRSIHEKYNFERLLSVITSRLDRCALERIIAVLFQSVLPKTNLSLFGDIYDYLPWDTRFEEKHLFPNKPVIKVWTGR